MSRPQSRRRRHSQANPHPQTSPMTPTKATCLLICLCAALSSILCGIVLFFIGKLPQVIGAIAGCIAGFLLLIVAIVGPIGETVKSFIPKIWQRARKGLSIAFGVGIPIIIALVIGFFGPSSDGSAPIDVLHDAPAGPRGTLEATKWQPLLKQQAPNCNNPQGTSWLPHLRGTFLKCSDTYLLMQRISPDFYADMELVQVNNRTYNQTTFRVQVQITFQNPTDTTTLAALLVQTPAQPTAVGGYALALNSKGQWQLQDIISGANIPIVKSGSVGIDSSKPVLMTVAVKDGLLVGYINKQPVVWFNDSLNPSPGQIGLQVQGQAGQAASSPIYYSNLELAV